LKIVISKIDAHQHFWKFDAAEYGWISPDQHVLRRDFLPADLHKEMSAAGIGGCISIQARSSVEETRWLLELAGQHEFILGVAGWVPLTDPHVKTVLEKFASNKKLRSIRHTLQDEADPNYMLRADFNRGVSDLKYCGLAYDILIFERHLPQTIQFVDKHPGQIFIVDHLAKPRVADHIISPWRENMRELAKRPNVYCKISGLATEADHAKWTESQLEPYMDTVLSIFGPKRTMFGSDWPVCQLAISYQHWAALVTKATAKLSQTEQERFWAGAAREAYGLT
jgi:L-fuconolactonase